MSHTIDTGRGEIVTAVSQQWAFRSVDERFTSLTELRDQVAKWAAESRVESVMPKELVAIYDKDRPNWIGIKVGDSIVEASHWSFDQIARLAGAPSNYLRTLPAPLAATNLNYGLRVAEQKELAAYVRDPDGGGSPLLRGLTSPRYGRILDKHVSEAVMKVAGDGTGDARWKVPGAIDWSSRFGITYNPKVEVTTENTTLYASDRDIFLFLVDDMNPIEVGKLKNGDPDLMFRGFYVWNSEVGCRTFGFASMYLRGVCQNRNLWGVEGFSEVKFKHTSGAPERFAEEVGPALVEYADGGTSKLVLGVQAARQAVVATNDEERIEFLAKFGFSERAGRLICSTALDEEGEPPVSVWDFAQGVTAVARREEFQENRLKLEATAGRMLDKVRVTT